MKIQVNKIVLESFDNGCCSFLFDQSLWKMNQGRAHIAFSDHNLYFDEMNSTQSFYRSGIGEGILTQYQFNDLSFETLVWIEFATSDVYFELIPIHFEEDFDAIYWPNAFEFEEKRKDWITLLPHMQGLMIPNDYENECRELNFHGQFCTNGAYMPWLGQIRKNEGIQLISLTPWDGGYQIDHPAKGPYTHASMRHLSSLKHLGYRRIIRLTYFKNASIVSLCKNYRTYAKEKGLLVTLKEKNARNSYVDQLIGSAILHKGIKTHICEDSIFYDALHPENNDLLVSFQTRAKEIERYHEMGIEKLYLHLDGWGEGGYDNQHPDYLPACEKAGGWEGLKELSDTLLSHHDLFGLHDQYRDYYFKAATFNKNQAVLNQDGSITDVARWAGGRQTYLCASLASHYVKRNFEEVLSHGIHLSASYLDVFTCNEPDECYDLHHRMSRKECLEYREDCFNYLHSKNILPSSEECSDWAMRSLVFAHYGPYDFMLTPPKTPRKGIPVPLFNLVYHDCIILPWSMDHFEGCEDYMLYALLNGGAAYVDKDGAYPDTDGAFSDEKKRQLEKEIERYQLVSDLQKRVAKLEMIDFGFLDEDAKKQYSVFEDGTRVEIDLHQNTYQIIMERKNI